MATRNPGTIDPTRTVAELATQLPGRTRVFASLGIEYCCGGNVPLQDAVAAHGLDLDAVIEALDAESAPIDGERDWSDASVGELVGHVVDVHHRFLRTNLPHLTMLVEKVARRHGDGDPRLVEVRERFLPLAERLYAHIAEEELELFPAMVALEEAAADAPESATYERLIAHMSDEHRDVGEHLDAIRALVDGFRVPEHACTSYRAMLDGLERADLDIRQHVHEENHVLFPRFVERLQDEAGGGRTRRDVMPGTGDARDGRAASGAVLASRLLAGLVLLVVLAAMGAWIARWHDVLVWHGGAVPITATAALSLAAVALGCMLPVDRPALRRAGAALGAGATVMPLLTLVEYAAGVRLPIDELLAPDTTGVLAHPGRMSAVAAAGVLALGAALAHRNWLRRWCVWSEGLLLAVGAVGYFSFAGYANGITTLYRHGGRGVADPLTALVFALLCVVLLTQPPHPWVDRWSRRQTLGGQMVRRTLPFAILAPLVLGIAVRVVAGDGEVSAPMARFVFGEAIVVVFGAVAVLFSLHLDVLERREMADLAAARDRATAAYQMKSALLATVSHELRTPLNGILGMARALVASESLADPQREQSRHIVASGQRLLGLVDDLLDMSVIEAGRMGVEHAPLDLVAELRDVVADYETLARDKGLDLRLDVSGGVPEVVLGDARRVRQVVASLVSNAVKFTARGGVCVRVSAVTSHRRTASIRIEVVDSGHGIDASRLSEIFAPFVQEDSSLTRGYGGAGIGLAIARALADLMGGTLTASSVPGEGSTFVLQLSMRCAGEPGEVADTADVDSREPPSSPAPWSSGGVRPVLVVEDNHVNQQVVEFMLTRLGVPYRMVDDGAAAVEAFATAAYSLVLLDCQLPVLDGYDAARAMREHEGRTARGTHTPIVAMTAHTRLDHLDRGVAAGMDDHLYKPFELGDLDAALRRWWPTAAGSGAAPTDVRQAADEDDDWEQFIVELWQDTADDHERRAASILAAAQSVAAGTAQVEAVLTARAAAHDLAGTMKNFGLPRAGEFARSLSPYFRRFEELQPAEAQELLAIASELARIITEAAIDARAGRPVREGAG